MSTTGVEEEREARVGVTDFHFDVETGEGGCSLLEA
jgi:hypothetical protein